MGIPSFYRSLCRRFPHLIGRGVGPAPEWLCLDFNCAMYYVLRQQPPIAEATSQEAWEAAFAAAIAAYMEELVGLVRPTRGVFVSCDGVVCAAKRRQQRLRRFKGPWMAAATAAVTGGLKDVPTWDQNALTPGSAFMARLGDVLTVAGSALASRLGGSVTVTVSTTSEPGEGEHKLLAAMRTVRPAACTIYGLDADLILLAMLLRADTGADVRLLREAQEFESDSSSDEWRHLDICGLTDVMMPPSRTEDGQLRDYVAAMSLLGNDFLPRSLTRTVRDDGIPKLLDTLERCLWSRGDRLVSCEGEVVGGLRRAALLAIIDDWAATEEGDMLAAAVDAIRAQRRPAGIADTPEATALREWQATPARWGALTRLLVRSHGGGLISGWRSLYRNEWRAGSAQDYLAGLAWVWDYYTGKPVDLGWTFDEHLPPLWSDVAAALRTSPEYCIAPPALIFTKALPEWLHLLSVLPADSVVGLLPPVRQRLMARAPWYWPAQWSLFDVGRGQLWECEPVIPTIPETVLRSWI